jgi:hypothetical protein
MRVLAREHVALSETCIQRFVSLRAAVGPTAQTAGKHVWGLTALLFEATAAGNSSLSYCAFPAAPKNVSGYAGWGNPMQITLRCPTVTCPGCKRPMTPSPPLAVSEDTDLCDLTYSCKKCGATTTRTIKIEK